MYIARTLWASVAESRCHSFFLDARGKIQNMLPLILAPSMTFVNGALSKNPPWRRKGKEEYI